MKSVLEGMFQSSHLSISHKLSDMLAWSSVWYDTLWVCNHGCMCNYSFILDDFYPFCIFFYSWSIVPKICLLYYFVPLWPVLLFSVLSGMFFYFIHYLICATFFVFVYRSLDNIFAWKLGSHVFSFSSKWSFSTISFLVNIVLAAFLRFWHTVFLLPFSTIYTVISILVLSLNRELLQMIFLDSPTLGDFSFCADG